MWWAVETQKAVRHLVVQRARGDALCRQGDAGRQTEPVVAQHIPSHLVRQDFRAERSDGDGREGLRTAEIIEDVLRGSGESVVECGEVSVEDVGSGHRL